MSQYNPTVYTSQTQTCRNSVWRSRNAECRSLSLSCVAGLLTVLSVDASSRRQFIHCHSHSSPRIPWMPCTDAEKLQTGYPDEVAQRYILPKTHQVVTIKRAISILWVLLNGIMLKTVTLCSYGDDLWSNKPDIQHWHNQQFLARTAEWQRFHTQVLRLTALSFSSSLFFSSSVSSLVLHL